MHPCFHSAFFSVYGTHTQNIGAETLGPRKASSGDHTTDDKHIHSILGRVLVRLFPLLSHPRFFLSAPTRFMLRTRPVNGRGGETSRNFPQGPWAH